MLCEVWTIFLAPLTTSRSYQKTDLERIVILVKVYTTLSQTSTKNVHTFSTNQVVKKLSILCKVLTIFLARLTNPRPYQKTDLKIIVHTFQSTYNIITNVKKNVHTFLTNQGF